MEITAIFKGLTNYQEGINKKGESWKKQEAVFETTGEYPKTIAVTGFNAVSDMLAHCETNQAYDLKIDIESREWNGKWYTSITAFAVYQHAKPAAPAAPAPSPTQYQPKIVATLEDIAANGEDDDLPF